MDLKNVGEQVWVLATTYGIRIVGVLTGLVVAWIVAGLVQRTARRGLERVSFDPTLSRFLCKLLRWAVLLIAGVACLGIFGIQTASFAAVLAAGGLAIGLAFQGTLSNFAAGVMLLVFRPFKVDQTIEVAACRGRVDAIDLFTTTMTTPDNRQFIVPNSSVFGATIENVSHYPTRRVDVNVGVDYDADLDATRAVLLSVVSGIEGALKDPPPYVVLTGLGTSSVDWSIRLWCQTGDYWDLHEELLAATKKGLDAAGIGIPFPQMDVHLDSPEAIPARATPV